jgi:CHC2 zinc finger
MNRCRFSEQQLYIVRNHIPIRYVIESLLNIPSKTAQGTFRFLCPQCSEYNTAINPQTNLARCFSCEKNFNPIDMVMLIRRIDFIETVNLLMNCKKSASPDEKQSLHADNKNLLLNQSVTERKPCKEFVPIGDILTQLIGNKRHNCHKSDNEKLSLQKLSSSNDIAELERIVEALSQQIKQLKSHL